MFTDLKQQGLFQEKTDIALSLSTDGVKVFKTRSAFQIWPIMLVRELLPWSRSFLHKALNDIVLCKIKLCCTNQGIR